jgi:hypothetical protein
MIKLIIDNQVQALQGGISKVKINSGEQLVLFWVWVLVAIVAACVAIYQSLANPALKRDWLTAGFRPLPASPLAPRYASLRRFHGQQF